MRNVIDVLEERGFVEALTSPELRSLVEKPLHVYCGFDPSSDSLHLGNLVAIMGLAWFQQCGHYPVVIVGGATGMIGDPSGKTTERQLLDEAAIEKNVCGIQKNLETVLASSEHPVTILNNYDWFKNFTFVSFLRDVGKYFRMGPMLAKDSVKGRMTSEEGMSFTEFSYQVLQGYDFLHLFETHQVTVQLGGSDQWGNITAGTDLIRKVKSASAYGVTFPLLTRSDGQKFGKSEKGAIWLSAEKVSPYEFYQYLVRVADADVIKLLKLLTFMEMSEIRNLEKKMHDPDYVPNTAQKILAELVTKLIHGADGLQKALSITQKAAPGSETTLDPDVLHELSKEIPCFEVKRDEVIGCKLIDLIAKSGLLPSKSEARRLIKNGGVYLNNQKVEDEASVIRDENVINSHLILLSAGKKNKRLVKIKD